MKQTIKLVILAAMLALTLPALAKAQTGNVAAGACTDEVKNTLYTKFLANRQGKTAENANGDQDVAYNTAKEYMTTCPTDESAQAKYMKKWMASYEVGARKAQFLLAYDKKNYAEMMTLGKQVLADDPNYVRANILLGYIGYLASVAGNTSLNAESGTYAKQAIALLEAGKTPDDWRPFTSKDDALAWLHYSVGYMTLKTSPGDAIPSLLKAARIESSLKKTPAPYYYVALAYEEGPNAKQTEEYNRLYKDKPETPESKLAQANINQLIDRTIDAYARAVALSTATDATTQKNKKDWLERLTVLYTYRYKSITGLNELMAGILNKPLPDVPTPLTSLPTPPATGAMTPATPPAGTPGGTTPPVAPKPTPAATTSAQPVNKTTTTPKTTGPSTTQAAKPKPKRNHRRRP